MWIFGNKRKKALDERGIRSEAQIISVISTSLFVRSGSELQYNKVQRKWKFVVEIKPEDGSNPFQARVKGFYPMHGAPTVRKTLWVVYDPLDHTNVAIDKSDFDKIDQLKEALGADAALAELEKWKQRGKMSQQQFEAASQRLKN